MKEIFVFFLTLALGYGLCVHAKKEKGVYKTLGTTLGIATIVFTMLAALLLSQGLTHKYRNMPCPCGMKHGMPCKMPCK